MTEIPTNETIAEQVQAAIAEDEKLKQCITCRHYNRASRECDVFRQVMLPFIRGCNGKHFDADIKYMVDRVRNEIKEEATECDKMDNMFALSITVVNSVSCLFTRVHKMIKALRKREKNPVNKKLLYKDMECIEEMQRGVDMINERMSAIYATLDAGLEDIDHLYRMYIEPQTNKLFTIKGKFDSKQSDNHLNNSMDICELLIKYTRGCICNEHNYNAVISMLNSLNNDYPYALTLKDAESFRLKK